MPSLSPSYICMTTNRRRLRYILPVLHTWLAPYEGFGILFKWSSSPKTYHCYQFNQPKCNYWVLSLEIELIWPTCTYIKQVFIQCSTTISQTRLDKKRSKIASRVSLIPIHPWTFSRVNLPTWSWNPLHQRLVVDRVSDCFMDCDPRPPLRPCPVHTFPFLSYFIHRCLLQDPGTRLLTSPSPWYFPEYPLTFQGLVCLSSLIFFSFWTGSHWTLKLSLQYEIMSWLYLIGDFLIEIIFAMDIEGVPFGIIILDAAVMQYYSEVGGSAILNRVEWYIYEQIELMYIVLFDCILLRSPY